MIRENKTSERGVATVEFAETAVIFLLMRMAAFAGGYLFWIHNALVEATRRGARYAANQCRADLEGCPDSGTVLERVRNVTVYGSPTSTTNPLIYSLQPSNVTLEYSP